MTFLQRRTPRHARGLPLAAGPQDEEQETQVFPSRAGEETAMAEAEARLRIPPFARTLGEARQQQPQHDGPPSAAFLLSVMEGQPRTRYPLGNVPQFAGTAVTPDGQPAAEMYLGTNGSGYVKLGAVSPEWCKAAAVALTLMHDRLMAAREQAPADAGEAAEEGAA